MPLRFKYSTCVDCGRLGPVTGNSRDGYRCGEHYRQYRARVSRAKREKDSGYTAAAKAFKQRHPVCQAQLPACTRATTEVHHKRGRSGGNLMDEATWLAVCRNCHRWIEEHPDDAKARGFSENRLT